MSPFAPDFPATFPTDYAASQHAFLAAAAKAGAVLETHTHPEKGPAGEPLHMHVARLGAPDVRKLLVMSAGTHGAEGFCGSGCLTGWLETGGYKQLPEDIGALLIHYVNPYGVAWRCRQTEGNVDLNRNFIDHAAGAYPANPGYDALHDDLVCPALTGPDREAADARLDTFATEHGPRAYNTAILTGQYDHPGGLFYGGRAPVWSHRTVLEVMTRHCAGVRDVAHLDYHTGLGPYGYAILVNGDLDGTEGLRRALAWYGETVEPIRASGGAGNDDGPSAVGDMASGIHAALSEDTIYTYAAIEYGTYPIDRFIEVYRADCIDRRYNVATPAQKETIRQDFLDFFYPNKDDWKEMVWWRSRQVIRQALAGLSGC